MAPQIARFKQSITCSYTPSILGYYQLSRILGGAGRVPPVVIRTMEKNAHLALVRKAIGWAREKYPLPQTIIRRAWEQDWTQAHNNPEGSKAKPFPVGVQAPWLFDAAHQRIYGALLSSRKDPDYTEVSGRYTYATRYESFKQQPAYRRITRNTLVSAIVGTNLAEAVPLLVQMKDVSDMVLMDFIMNQQDRVGNIVYQERWYTLTDGHLQIRTAESKNGTPPAGAIKVKEVILRDNDCGVTKANLARQHRWLEGVAHLSPRTYHRLLWLHAQLETSVGWAYFRRELLFTERDFASIRSNVIDAAQLLQARCRTGALHLDLDLLSQLQKQNTQDNRPLCELPTGYGPGSVDFSARNGIK